VHAARFQIELGEIVAIKGRGRRERLQDPDRAGELAVERGRVDPRRFEQAPLANRPVVCKRTPGSIAPSTRMSR
jgi:hypothetical protein